MSGHIKCETQHCFGDLVVEGEHVYPMGSHPRRWIARCTSCRGFWPVGILPRSYNGMDLEHLIKNEPDKCEHEFRDYCYDCCSRRNWERARREFA